MEGSTKLDTIADAAAAAMRANIERCNSESEQSGASMGLPDQIEVPTSSSHPHRIAAKRSRGGAAKCNAGVRVGGKAHGKAPRSHVATEQRRRDRINDGFEALRELIPHKDKLDKAAFLHKTIDYIGQMQGVLRKLLDSGIASGLTEELQWTIRMLVSRPGIASDFGAGASEAAPSLKQRFQHHYVGIPITQSQHSPIPSVSKRGSTTEVGVGWRPGVTGPLPTTPLQPSAPHRHPLPHFNTQQWVTLTKPVEQQAADEHKRLQYVSAGLPAFELPRAASCASQGMARPATSSVTASFQPSEDAVLHSLRVLLASVPATKLHSALASVLSQAPQRSDEDANTFSCSPVTMHNGSIPQQTFLQNQQPHRLPISEGLGTELHSGSKRPRSHHRQHLHHQQLHAQEQSPSECSQPRHPSQPVAGETQLGIGLCSHFARESVDEQVPKQGAPQMQHLAVCAAPLATLPVAGLTPATLHHMAAWFAANSQTQPASTGSSVPIGVQNAAGPPPNS